LSVCLLQGLHRSCSQSLTCADVLASGDLKKWICLCLFKLCEDFPWAKYLCITETGHPQLYPLLNDADTSVRAASVLALGELFGSSLMSPPITHHLSAQSPPRSANSSMNNLAMNSFNSLGNLSNPLFADHTANLTEQIKRLLETELLLAIQLLDSCTDGCVMVRKEAVTALNKFISLPVHVECAKIVVSELRNFVRLHDTGYVPSAPLRASEQAPSNKSLPISIINAGSPASSNLQSVNNIMSGASAANSAANFGISSSELNFEGNAVPSSNSVTNFVLTQMQVESIIMKLDEYLERIGFNTRDVSSMNLSHGSVSPTFTNSYYNMGSHTANSNLTGGAASTDNESRNSLDMARNYLRLWLALQEVRLMLLFVSLMMLKEGLSWCVPGERQGSSFRSSKYR
jgi:hypothetical protein